MKDLIFDDFQNIVNDCLIRHKSVLDILTKFSESSTRINRAVAKSVTNCGCIKIDASKQCMPSNECVDIDSFKNFLDTHMNGELCENCRDIIEREIGNNLFYLMSLCNLLNLNLYDILLKEYNNMSTLGKYSLR